MIWLILILVGGGLIGGLMAFLASDSKTSSKDNDVDIVMPNGQGTQTEQGISRVPERSLYLNTTPAMAPIMQQPAMAPMMPQPQPNVPFDIPDEKKDIKNTQELNSLTSLLKNQEKIKQLEEENNKLSKDINDIKFENVTWESIKEKIESSRGVSEVNVKKELYELLEAVQVLSKLPDEQKKAIIDKIESIQSNGTQWDIIYTGGSPNTLAKSITDLKEPAATDAIKTRKEVLIGAMKSILYSEDYVKKIHALEDIIIQLSRRTQDNKTPGNSRISQGANQDNTTLKGVFRNAFGDQLQQKVNEFCDRLNDVSELIRKRKIDDQGFDYSNGVHQNFDPFTPLRLTNLFLDQNSHGNHLATDTNPATNNPAGSPVGVNGTPNNKEFGKIVDEINKQNTLARQFKEISQFYDDENRDKIKEKIVELNRQLFNHFTLLNKATDNTAKQNITNNIKGIIIDSLNKASSAKPDGGESDRKQIYNYLIKIGFKIQHADSTDIHNDCGTFKVENIQGIDSAILKDKVALPKVIDYCSKKLQINKNKKAIAQLKKNMISL